ncbi:MAG TPA: MurR/RpiR family transcriptional regulator [Chloroflexi bacterium]|jgi:DNA-binding MurR/RpiR family transcriptional regulator|nr:MurR/RpiR family transcriptional regulator [Chloroflexota bacterium]
MILEKIRQVYPQLTKSQRRLADFIATSYQEAAFMTASRLARTLDLNEATVIRFAQRLGYPGYPELVQDVQDVVQKELGTREAPETEVQDPFIARLYVEIDHLQRATSHISPAVAQQIVTMIQDAQRVFVLGQGIAAPLAQMFSLLLRQQGIRSEHPPADALGLALALSDVDSQSLVIGVSLESESHEVANALSYADRQGAGTLALADTPISPCAQAARVALTCVAGEASPSCVAMMALVMDTLVQSLQTREPEKAERRSHHLDEARRAILFGQDGMKRSGDT